MHPANAVTGGGGRFHQAAHRDTARKNKAPCRMTGGFEAIGSGEGSTIEDVVLDLGHANLVVPARLQTSRMEEQRAFGV